MAEMFRTASAGVRHKQHKSYNPKKQRSYNIKAQVHHRRPLGCPGTAHTGKHGCDTGADILSQGDVDGGIGGHHTV